MRRRSKILIALAGALGAVILMAVIRHYQLRADTDAYIAQLKAQGERMDLASILPPPVPPEENGADTLRQVAALLDTNTTLLKTNYDIPAMKMVAPGKAMIGWQQPDVRAVDATNSWQDVGAAIAQNTNIFALLHQIMSKPDFDFQIQYSRGTEGLDFSKMDLAQSKEAAQWLSAAAVYRLHDGDQAKAVDDVRAMLAVTQALRDQRFVISELVRIAIAHIAEGATWEILQAPAVTDAQLAQLQNDWVNLDFIRSGENALAMERIGSGIDLAKWRAAPSEFERHLNKDWEVLAMNGMADDKETFWNRISLRPKIYIWKYWWSYPDELRYLKGYQILINTLRMADSSGSFQSAMDYEDTRLNKLRLPEPGDVFSGNSNFHTMFSESVPVMRAYVRRIMIMEVARRIVTTAIALKRYQLKHGDYPPNLDAIVRSFPPAVTLDPVDGKPLRYRPNQDGTYLLYSVGPNGKDDGGNPEPETSGEGGNMSWLNNHALDWVWPQPATAAEIQNYWSHPKK
jgi:hypothetical protein